MKKICFFALSFLVAVATIIPVYMRASVNMERSRPSIKEVVIQDIKIPLNPGRPRSAAPIVAACYSSDMSMLEVYFNYKVGTVKINILDGMQQCVAQYTCDTEIEGEVFLNLTLSPNDIYAIHIIGNEYEGIGYFNP